MNTNLSPTLAAGEASSRTMLPHADTDDLQKRLAVELVPYGQQMLDDMRIHRSTRQRRIEGPWVSTS